jgi:hypothetical protein
MSQQRLNYRFPPAKGDKQGHRLLRAAGLQDVGPEGRAGLDIEYAFLFEAREGIS